MFQSHSHHIVLRRRRPGNGFRCVWAFKNPTLHDFWVRANLGVYGRVTGQGVSRARACHGPGRVTDQGVSRTRVWSWFGPGLLSVSVLVLYCSLLLHFTTFNYLLLLFTTFHCLLLHLTTLYYLLLPFTTFYYFSLLLQLLNAFFYILLLFTTFY